MLRENALAAICGVLAFSFPIVGQRSDPSDRITHTVKSIVLERSTCYGKCSSYRIIVKSDGSFTFSGRKFVHRVGELSGRVNAYQMRRLTLAVKNARFFSMRKSYATREDGCRGIGSDESWITLTISAASNSKTVKHYLGCYAGSNAFEGQLRRLDRLERQIISILGLKESIGSQL